MQTVRLPQNCYFTEEYAALTLSGEGVVDFLQALITQDVLPQKEGELRYSCLLNAQGKFLHDFFVLRKNDHAIALYVRADADMQGLLRLFTFYRLRKQIVITEPQKITLFRIWTDDAVSGWRDPRHPDLGYLSCELPPDNVTAIDASLYDCFRISLGVPHSPYDMHAGISTAEELNMTRLNAISLTKGCFVGQELTARVHHRGLAKKHLYGVRMSVPAISGQEVKVSGEAVGEIRSVAGNMALALLKDSALAEGKVLTLDNGTVLEVVG